MQSCGCGSPLEPEALSPKPKVADSNSAWVTNHPSDPADVSQELLAFQEQFSDDDLRSEVASSPSETPTRRARSRQRQTPVHRERQMAPAASGFRIEAVDPSVHGATFLGFYERSPEDATPHPQAVLDEGEGSLWLA